MGTSGHAKSFLNRPQQYFSCENVNLKNLQCNQPLIETRWFVFALLNNRDDFLPNCQPSLDWRSRLTSVKFNFFSPIYFAFTASTVAIAYFLTDLPIWRFPNFVMWRNLEIVENWFAIWFGRKLPVLIQCCLFLVRLVL